MRRENGYLYEVTLKAIVELTLPPSTPKKKLREALYANGVENLKLQEKGTPLDLAAKLAVDDWMLIERRGL